MLFGADYYPEHWPEERWKTDARLMKEAGFNLVRLAEFAWVKMEPREGEFDFDWLTASARDPQRSLHQGRPRHPDSGASCLALHQQAASDARE